MNGVVGDPLTDNIADRDGYRFHDVFHFAHPAVLHWSPTFRALVKRKRKSDPLCATALYLVLRHDQSDRVLLSTTIPTRRGRSASATRARQAEPPVDASHKRDYLRQPRQVRRLLSAVLKKWVMSAGAETRAGLV
jgi:hypothetical protein